MKTPLAIPHQARAEAKASGLRQNVEREDSSDIADRLGDCKSRDSTGEFTGDRKLGDPSNSLPAGDETGQVHLGVGDSRRKASLVDLPQKVEISSTIIADEEIHVLSLQGPVVVRQAPGSFR